MSSEGEGLGSTFTVLLPKKTSSSLIDDCPPRVILRSSLSSTRRIEALTPSQPSQSITLLPPFLSHYMIKGAGSTHNLLEATPGTIPPMKIGKIRPVPISSRFNYSLLNLNMNSIVATIRGKPGNRDMVNESSLVRPFTAASIMKSPSGLPPSGLCDVFSDVKTSSAGVVSALDRPNLEECISDISEQRSHSGIFRHSMNRHAIEYAMPRSVTRVLIVDDMAMNRKMLRRVLESRFDVIDEAEDGHKAVEIIAKSLEGGDQFLYDVITMDYQMPVMDGVTATRRIRSLGFLGKIIAVTGNALEEDVLTFKASGADAVLMKPLDIKLFDMIIKPNIPESK